MLRRERYIKGWRLVNMLKLRSRTFEGDTIWTYSRCWDMWLDCLIFSIWKVHYLLIIEYLFENKRWINKVWHYKFIVWLLNFLCMLVSKTSITRSWAKSWNICGWSVVMRLCCRCSSVSCWRWLRSSGRRVEILLKESCRTCNNSLPSRPGLQKTQAVIRTQQEP